MKKVQNLVAMLILALLFASCANENPFQPVESKINPNDNIKEQYILEYSPISGIQANSFNCAQYTKSVLESHNIDVTNVVALYDKVIQGFCAKLSATEANELQKDSRIKIVEKDQIVTIQGYREAENMKQGNILVQTANWGVSAVGGSVDATSNSGVAWILDTGVDLDHPDLNVNTTLARSFVSAETTADDGNGHGTHCAGIVAAKNNTIGALGVCAGATVIPVKVLNYLGSGSYSQIISGLNYVYSNKVANRLNVVNLSLGGGISSTLDNAVTNLANSGVYVCVAAGNNSANANNYSPARANGTRVYTISAFDNTGRFASFSNYANPPIDFSAPGVNIYSTYKNGAYAGMSGTSMATPFVCGILLATNGTINYSGTVTGDRDSVADYKARR